MNANIGSLVFTPGGLLIGQKDASLVSFVYESAADTFFYDPAFTLLEIYTDLFTKNLGEIKVKYRNFEKTMFGIFDVKMSLPISIAEKTGVMGAEGVSIYLSRVTAQGLNADAFVSMISSIHKVKL